MPYEELTILVSLISAFELSFPTSIGTSLSSHEHVTFDTLSVVKLLD